MFFLISHPNQVLHIIKQVKTTLKAFFALANFLKFIYVVLQVNTFPNLQFLIYEHKAVLTGNKTWTEVTCWRWPREDGPTQAVDWDALSLTQMENVCPSQAQCQTFIHKNKDSQENLLPHSKIAVFLVTERLKGQSIPTSQNREHNDVCEFGFGFFVCMFVLIYFGVIHSYLFSGSFCRHDEIIFLNDFPYFFSISLSCTPVSKDGGSFCSVSIKTWNNYCYWKWDFPWAVLETDLRKMYFRQALSSSIRVNKDVLTTKTHNLSYCFPSHLWPTLQSRGQTQG